MRKMIKNNWKMQSLNLIVTSMCSFMLFNFLTTVSLNVFIPAVAELKEMNAATLYHWNTAGNLTAVLIALVIGAVAQKISLKALSVFGLFLGGFSYFMIPIVPDYLTGLFIALNYIATMFYAQITISARVGNWYPKRKGEMLGIVTSIIVLSSVAILPIYSRMNTEIGIAATMKVFGVIVMIWAALNIFLIKDRPEDAGLNPENMTTEEMRQSGTDIADTETQSKWTYLKLLKKPRFVFSAVGWGLSFIGIMGLALAIIPIMTSKGVSPEMATKIASFAGFFQFFGSVISGFIDTRVGQRFVITLFICLEIVGLIIFGAAPDGKVLLLIIGYYIVMFMMGAPNNLQPSMYLSMAGGGGKDFMMINSLQTAIAATLRSFSSSIIAFSTTHFGGSYMPAITIFLISAVLSVILLNVCGFKKLEQQ